MQPQQRPSSAVEQVNAMVESRLDTPKQRALDVREALSREPEEKSVWDKMMDLPGKFMDSISKDIEKGDVGAAATKGILVAGGAWLTFELTKPVFEGLGSLFDWGKEKIFGIASESKDSLLSTALKLLVPAGIAGSIIGIFSKSGLEIGELLKNATSTKNLATYLWEKAKEGSIELTDDLKAWIEPITSGNPAELATKGFEWMDEKLDFSQRKTELIQSLESSGIAIPEWLVNLKASEVAQKLNLDKALDGTWTDYAGMAGFAFLIYKFAGAKTLMANAGLYLFIVKQGKESPLNELALKPMTQELDSMKQKFIDKAAGNTFLEAFLPDFFAEISFEDSVDDLFDLMQKHPALALGSMNALWYSKGFLWFITKKLAEGSVNLAALILKHPLSTAAGVVGGALYRKEIIKKLGEIFIEDDTSRTNFYNFSKTFGIDVNEKDAPLEGEVKLIMESLLEDPIEAMNKFGDSIESLFQKGDASFMVDAAGGIFFLLKGMVVPYQLGDLAFENFQKAFGFLWNDEQDFDVADLGMGLGMGVVFTRMTAQSVKAARIAVWDSAIDKSVFRKAFRTLNPRSPEWKFILKSSFLGIPGAETFYKQILSLRIPRAESFMTKVEKAVASGDFKKAAEEAEDVLRALHLKGIDDFKNALPGNTATYKFANELEAVHRELKAFINEATKGEYADKKVVQGLLGHVNGSLGNYKTRLSSVLKRFHLVCRGEFKEAMKIQSPDAKPQSQLEKREQFQGNKVSEEVTKLVEGKTPEQLKSRITELQQNPKLTILERKELAVLQGYVTKKYPAVAENLLEGLDDLQKTRKLEMTAIELAEAEKGVNAAIQLAIDETKEFAIKNNLKLDDPKIQERLTKIDQDLVMPFAKQKAENIKSMNQLYKNLPKGLRTTTLKNAVKKAMYGAEEGTLFVRLKKGAIGRAKLMGVMSAVMVGVDAASNFEKIKQNPATELANILHDLGPAMIQLLIDVLPFVGTYSNLHSAVAGEQLYDKNTDVSGAGDRITNALFGVGGAIADILTVASFGAGTVPNILARTAAATGKMGLRGARMAQKIKTVVPQFEKIATKMGGWKEFAKNFVDIVTSSKSQAEKVAKYAMYGGTAAMAGNMAIGMFYTNTESIDVAEIDEDLRTNS